MTPPELTYLDGYRDGLADGEAGRDYVRSQARVAAFGAIRRAASVARECDFIANEHADISYTDGEVVERDRARCIRQAIRHAIGSEKA